MISMFFTFYTALIDCYSKRNGTRQNNKGGADVQWGHPPAHQIQLKLLQPPRKERIDVNAWTQSLQPARKYHSKFQLICYIYSNNKWLECFSPFRVESGVNVGSTVRALCHFLSLMWWLWQEETNKS